MPLIFVIFFQIQESVVDLLIKTVLKIQKPTSLGSNKKVYRISRPLNKLVKAEIRSQITDDRQNSRILPTERHFLVLSEIS